MSILVDHQIRELCLNPKEGIPPLYTPFSEAIQDGGVISYGLTSAGVDLRLGPKVLIFKNTRGDWVDPKLVKADNQKIFDVIDGLKPGEKVWIPPGGYILGYALEKMNMPRWLKATCIGKSSLARCGIHINTTPVEPGWIGHLTLEIANHTPCQVCVFAFEGICQVEFHTFHGGGVPEISYDQKKGGVGGGAYQNQGEEPIPGKKDSYYLP